MTEPPRPFEAMAVAILIMISVVSIVRVVMSW